MFEIEGKVALVTGGTSGIGLEIANALLDKKIKGVAIIGRNEEKGKKNEQILKKRYGESKAIFLKADISDKNQFENAFKSTIEVFKNLDIVVNCAGIIFDKVWENEILINLIGTATGTVLAMEKYLPEHRTGNEAVVLNVSSLVGISGSIAVPIYSATKSGIIRLSQNFGSDVHYERTKVRVMVLCPGLIDTPMLESSENTFINNNYAQLAEAEFSEFVPLDSASVAKTAMQMIVEGKNGCIWGSYSEEVAFEIIVQPEKRIKK